MENSNNFDTISRNFSINGNENIQSFHGNPELVNFPSTSQIFQAVFENKYYASCIGNCNGQTLKANERACRMFGYTPEEMQGLTVNNLFDTATKNYANYLVARDRERKTKAVITGIRKNGNHFPCEISSLIYFDDNGEKRTLSTLQDLSKNYSKTFLG